MRIALAQLNPTVGDVAGNAQLVLEALAAARAQSAEIIVTPELVLLGYPPRDLLLRDGVVEACEEALHQIAAATADEWLIIGHPRTLPGSPRPFGNSLSIAHRGRVVLTYDKRLLPGYDVFDEDRYFQPGRQVGCLDAAGCRVGLLVCEDIWEASDVETRRRYSVHPVTELMEQQPDVLVTINASPFIVGKHAKHVAQLGEVARRCGLPIVSVNQVGANDDLVFDGRSMILGRDGAVLAAMPGFESGVRVFELDVRAGAASNRQTARKSGAAELQKPPQAFAAPESLWEVFQALVLGIRDYCRKTEHARVIVGLSGGIDSAVTAALAAAAVGPQHVTGLLMPSKYSSPGSITDAQALARNLGLARVETISIESAHEAVRRSIEPALGAAAAGVTDENIQARLRAIVLMALSNSAAGSLVLATGDKSELAAGYTTIYGDMAGALSPLGDVLKTRVYAVARWMNAHHEACGFSTPPVPAATLTKAPSPELRANQKAQDTLPPYETLDRIVEHFIEHERSPEWIAQATGLEPAFVERWCRAIDIAQYKRDQAAIILKVSSRAFGRGRPMPIAMKSTAPGFAPLEGSWESGAAAAAAALR